MSEAADSKLQGPGAQHPLSPGPKATKRGGAHPCRSDQFVLFRPDQHLPHHTCQAQHSPCFSSSSTSTDTLTRLFGIPGKTASAVRRFGIGAVDKVPPLKNRFMAEARGETGTLPKLLQGLLV